LTAYVPSPFPLVVHHHATRTHTSTLSLHDALPILREVNKATCASGEPVSVSCRPNSLRISDFFSAVNAMRLSPISYFSPHEKSSLRDYFTTAANYSHKAITYLTGFGPVVQIVAPAGRYSPQRNYPHLPQRLHGILP